jgi:hypothetical protein
METRKTACGPQWFVIGVDQRLSVAELFFGTRMRDKMAETVQQQRRIVVIDENDKSKAIADGPSPDVRTDPARPGFASTRMWVSDRTPVPLKNLRESLHLPHTLEPPPGGSVCRVVQFPPDASYMGRIGAKEVQRTLPPWAHPGLRPGRRRRRTPTCRRRARSISRL